MVELLLQEIFHRTSVTDTMTLLVGGAIVAYVLLWPITDRTGVGLVSSAYGIVWSVIGFSFMLAFQRFLSADELWYRSIAIGLQLFTYGIGMMVGLALRDQFEITAKRYHLWVKRRQ